MRKNLESQALADFTEVAAASRLPVFRGQGSANRLVLSGQNYYQFGDLRVETPSRSVVVEVESGGGVTNLVKYWHAAAVGLLRKKMTLIHLFQQNSPQDYAAHLALWDFIAHRMALDVGHTVETRRYTYSASADLDAPLGYFRRCLDDA